MHHLVNFGTELFTGLDFILKKPDWSLTIDPTNEFGISFGLGIPAGGLFSNVNTTVEFGKRGTTNEDLVEENFVNFQLSLSLNDRWFIKRNIINYEEILDFYYCC